jgi:hypothetical protein
VRLFVNGAYVTDIKPITELDLVALGLKPLGPFTMNVKFVPVEVTAFATVDDGADPSSLPGGDSEPGALHE